VYNLSFCNLATCHSRPNLLAKWENLSNLHTISTLPLDHILSLHLVHLLAVHSLVLPKPIYALLRWPHKNGKYFVPSDNSVFAVTRVRAGQPKIVVRNPATARIFLLQVVQTRSGVIRSPVQWAPKVVSLEVKRPERTADHYIKARS